MTAASTSSVGPPLTLSQNPPRYGENSVEWPHRVVVQVDHNVGPSVANGLPPSIWGDESEFSYIFDLDHFKSILANDVRVVSSLPSTHLISRPVEEKRTLLHVVPQRICALYLRRLRKEGVLLLRGLDSRLSKDLPSGLQNLVSDGGGFRWDESAKESDC
ncbi:hypothetical protein F0562_017732 [Nyssa sinensis]|uniref:O-fucosyltransferase family protein n=1 Tax=Nyssa sinensis TaxID=561372 RepID=A0A5J4ZHA1_9ASTE|nr:hypothetical protein F0562_017732 [Nyssa sinensis]